MALSSSDSPEGLGAGLGVSRLPVPAGSIEKALAPGDGVHDIGVLPCSWGDLTGSKGVSAGVAGAWEVGSGPGVMGDPFELGRDRTSSVITVER